ncbi:hypothetical protein LZG04_26955 [Saccharothrix sp. S26]|uniref:hypothetical protein n=1 Tax=Saccharothrix sp. S26 TaxID=2907215 RepID=UPI001F3BE1B6|nr:hypothetical protein [Saccharothrix sp. S26]MCE6998412.1 hypothetical protein [Saccharothrix sp. S26]
MIQETYNPILHQRSGILLRFTTLRAPQRGTALVLEHRDGRLDVIAAGAPAPGRRGGGHRTAYLIDMTSHGLTFTVPSRSADPWMFSVTFRFSCSVIEPTVVVREGHRDMAAAVYESMATVARSVTPKFGVLDGDRAAIEVLDILRGARSPYGLDLSVVSVDVDAADAEDLRATQRNLLLERINREARRDVATGSRDEMLAHYMAINNGDPSAFLKMERDAQEAEAKVNLDLVRAALESGKLSAGESTRISKRILDRVVPTPQPGRTGQLRDRLRGTVPGALDAGHAVIDATGLSERGDGVRRDGSEVDE